MKKKDYFFNGELAQASRQLLTAMKKVFVKSFRLYDVLDWLNGLLSKDKQDYVADVCVWNVDLLDNEIKALARGIDPRLIKPDNIVKYSPQGS